MDEQSAAARLDELRKSINYHNYQYHVMDAPVISDLEFDRLIIELREIEAQFPHLVTTDSPSVRMGSQPVQKFNKLGHPSPILSLANAFSRDEILAWFDRNEKLDGRMRSTAFVVEPKIDGLTVVLHYHDGLFIQGATRGDGDVGEDITVNPVSYTHLTLPTKRIV